MTDDLQRQQRENNDLRDIVHAAQAEIARFQKEYEGGHSYTQLKEELDQTRPQLSDNRLTLKATKIELVKVRQEVLIAHAKIDTPHKDPNGSDESNKRLIENARLQDVHAHDAEIDETGNAADTTEELNQVDGMIVQTVGTTRTEHFSSGPMFITEPLEEAIQRTYDTDAMSWAIKLSKSGTKVHTVASFHLHER